MLPINKKHHMTKLFTIAILALLPAGTQAALLVQQWQGGGAGSGGLAGVDAVISSRAPDISAVYSIIDFTDDPFGFAGDIPGSTPWPLAAANGEGGVTGSIWNTDFAARISTSLTITDEDDYHFRTYSDDGVRLRIGGTDVIVDNSYHPEIPLFGTIHLTPGVYPLELVFFEGGGEASLEFSVAQGTGPYGHVGDIRGPGTSVPEGGSTSIVLLSLALGSIGLVRGHMTRGK